MPDACRLPPASWIDAIDAPTIEAQPGSSSKRFAYDVLRSEGSSSINSSILTAIRGTAVGAETEPEAVWQWQ